MEISRMNGIELNKDKFLELANEFGYRRCDHHTGDKEQIIIPIEELDLFLSRLKGSAYIHKDAAGFCRTLKMLEWSNVQNLKNAGIE